MDHQSARKCRIGTEKIASLYSAKLQNETKKRKTRQKPSICPPLEVFFMLSKPKLFFKLCTHAENPL